MNKLFKSFMLISIVLLLPMSSMAEDRIRFNYRLSGTMSNPELGTKTVSAYTQNVSGDKATGADKFDTGSYSAFSIHYTSDYGMGWLGGGEILLGLFSFSKSYTTKITATSQWITSATCLSSGTCLQSGTALAERKVSGTSRSLDIGYVYPIGEMSLGGGIALPILGSSADQKVEWTATGAAVSLMSSNGSTATEDLPPKGKSFSSYFINFGYALGSFEIIASYRTVTSKSEASLDTSKGVGAMLKTDVLESSGTDTSMMLGFGYLF